ncbi:MAG: NADH-quinone oxidoreductase subunit L [Anaerolineales bacterium]|nr:NADH-quinone oxidoreductase subunit L [Anaerolineales bacterium]
MEMNPLLIWLIPLPPLLAFFLILLFTRRNHAVSTAIALVAAGTSFVLSMIVFFNAIGAEHLAEHPFESPLNWLPVGSGFFSIGVLIDPLGAVSLFFVAWTVFMIFIYSVGYHNFGQPKGDHDMPGLPPHGATVEEHGHKHTVPSVEPMYGTFFAFIGLFAFGMFTLVVSNNLLTLFIGWEVMGLCSYLLIGFWYGKKSARDAGIKAFITTRIGDVFMLLGIAYLYTATGTLTFTEIFTPDKLHALATQPSGYFGLSAAGLIGILLFLGTVGKSAQFPLHVWLPDAMEGPTPVSAMIHAATMVSAGVYMVIRMFPLLSASASEGHGLTPPMMAMAFIGAFTALFAATIALAQNDVKRVLAYSTISQLGYMVAALGIGAYVAAVFHLITHAFFKALLFLGSGSVIHGMEHGVLHTGDHDVDPQDMFNMGGLRKKMPITFWTFLAGGLALSGFPVLTAGFWSKDEILADAFAHEHWLVFGTLALAAFLTAFYTMRQITLTFLGKPRTEESEHAHESVPWMTIPLVLLAVFAIGGGWVGIPEHFPAIGGKLPNWFHEFVGSMLGHPEALPFNIWPLLTSLVVALGGLGLGWLVYKDIPAGAEDPLKKPLGPLYAIFQNKYNIDEIYDVAFIRPSKWLAEKFTYLFLDRTVIDGILHLAARISYALGGILRNYFDEPVVNGSGDFAATISQWFGGQLRKLQTGKVQQYMLVAAMLVVGGLFYFFLVLFQ